MKLQTATKEDDYDVGEDEDQPESEDNDLDQKRQNLTCCFNIELESQTGKLYPASSWFLLGQTRGETNCSQGRKTAAVVVVIVMFKF